MSTIELVNLKKTQAFGRRLGEIALPGDIITLEGGLGAGKTTLTQAIADGIKVPDSFYVTSPTFALLHEYPGRIPLYHMDLYRISGEEEIEMLGFEDYMYGKGLAVIEWSEKLGSLTPSDRLHIKLSITGESTRVAVLTVHGYAWGQRLNDVAKTFSVVT